MCVSVCSGEKSVRECSFVVIVSRLDRHGFLFWVGCWNE